MIKAEKRRIRREINSLRSALCQDAIKRDSRVIAEKLRGLSEYENAAAVYTYIGCRGEVLTEDIISMCFADGKKVAVPKITDDRMSFIYFDDCTVTERNRFGIPEPVSGEEAKEPSPLIIVPGVAFSRRCDRLGYGGGFYDRFLREGSKSIGLAFAFQIFDEIPVEEHDIPVDIVITNEEIIGKEET